MAKTKQNNYRDGRQSNVVTDARQLLSRRTGKLRRNKLQLPIEATRNRDQPRRNVSRAKDSMRTRLKLTAPCLDARELLSQQRGKPAWGSQKRQSGKLKQMFFAPNSRISGGIKNLGPNFVIRKPLELSGLASRGGGDASKMLSRFTPRAVQKQASLQPVNVHGRLNPNLVVEKPNPQYFHRFAATSTFPSEALTNRIAGPSMNLSKNGSQALKRDSFPVNDVVQKIGLGTSKRALATQHTPRINRDLLSLNPVLPRLNDGWKLIVSNLDPASVSQQDVQELFGVIGKLASVMIIAPGVAEVTYASAADAKTAMTAYNGRTLDGRAMIINFYNEKTSMTEPKPSLKADVSYSAIKSAPMPMEIDNEPKMAPAPDRSLIADVLFNLGGSSEPSSKTVFTVKV